MSLNIKFPDSHYVGMVVRENDDLPLAFMTPEGSDKAAMARKASADGWVSRETSRYDHTTKQTVKVAQPKPAVLKNEAMAGFRLLDDIRHGGGGWGMGNVKWRVEDPRGFELEITSPNLMQILSCTVLDKGEILDRCMWAREGKENILVPVSSEVYQTAMVNTERAAKSASLRDVKMGDHVIMQNGKGGRYFGKMNMVEEDHRENGWKHHRTPMKLKLTPRHIFIDYDERVIRIVASPKPSEIIPGDVLLPDDAEKEMERLAAIEKKTRYAKTDESWSKEGGSYYDHGYTFSKVIPRTTRTTVEVSFDGWDYWRAPPVFTVDGTVYMAASQHNHNTPDDISGDIIDKAAWETKMLCPDSGVRSGWSKPTHFSKKDLILRGVKPYRPATKIETDKGIVFVVVH